MVSDALRNDRYRKNGLVVLVVAGGQEDLGSIPNAYSLHGFKVEGNLFEP